MPSKDQRTPTELDAQALGYVAGDCSIGFVTPAWSTRALAANRGEVISWRDASACKEGNAQSRRHCQKALGSNPDASKIFFLAKSPVKVYLYEQLAV